MEVTQKLTAASNEVHHSVNHPQDSTPNKLPATSQQATELNQFEVVPSPASQTSMNKAAIISESEDSDDVFEVITESMIEKIIRDISNQEKDKK